MKRVSVAAVALAFSVAVSSSADAQGGLMGGARKPISVVVSGGLTVPSGDLADFHDTGFHYDASMIFTFAGLPIAIRPEISLTTLKFKNSPLLATPPGTTTADVDDLRTRMLSAVGNVEIPLVAGLYAIAGVGALNSKVTSPDVDTEGQTALTFGAGAGFRFQISRIAGFVEGRFGAASYEKGKIGYSKAQFIPLTFGLVF